MKAGNRFAGAGGAMVARPQQDKALAFGEELRGNYLQGLIRASVPDAEAAARLSGALLSIVNESEKLQECTPASIVASALRGEGMGLTLGREYYVVPYKDKGLLALLLSTGEVADTNCVEVREGEYLGRDRRTKRPVLDFSVYRTDREAMEHPVIGYYFYIEKKDGYFCCDFMTEEEILEHARTYSKSFDLNTYLKLQNGELRPEEAERVKKSSPWYGSSESMMKKTVIRRLLNSGFVRLANRADFMRALRDDEQNEREYLMQYSDEGNGAADAGKTEDAAVAATAQVPEESAAAASAGDGQAEVESGDEDAMQRSFFA